MIQLLNLRENILKETTSKCPVCRKPKPAKVIRRRMDDHDEIIMSRHCPCHGVFESVISSDARFYHLAQGRPENRGGECGCGTSCAPVGGGRSGALGLNATDESKKGDLEKLSTCLALIEIVDSCNMACPTCFANSPLGASGTNLKYHSFEKLTTNIQGIIERKGKIEIIQFSGGEPTIHPDFFRLVEWVRTNPMIDYLVINTNGVRLSKDEQFVETLGALFKKYDNIQLYLQFDGPQEDGQKELRGGDFRGVREKAIRNCARFDLPITLAMTVNRANLGHLWETVEYARAFDNIRGASFQPMFLSGRTPEKKDASYRPLNTADIILGLHEQSRGALALDDFTPLPCGDPNCATIGWLFRMNGTYYSPSEHGIDIPALQAKLPDRVNYNIEDLKKCGCENTALGDLMKKLELKESNAFRLFIKPFMDEWTWDEDRIDRCCTHVITPDGKLDSFCRYFYGPINDASCC